MTRFTGYGVSEDEPKTILDIRLDYMNTIHILRALHRYTSIGVRSTRMAEQNVRRGKRRVTLTRYCFFLFFLFLQL